MGNFYRHWAIFSWSHWSWFASFYSWDTFVKCGAAFSLSHVISCCGYKIAKIWYKKCRETFQICLTIGPMLLFVHLTLIYKKRAPPRSRWLLFQSPNEKGVGNSIWKFLFVVYCYPLNEQKIFWKVFLGEWPAPQFFWLASWHQKKRRLTVVNWCRENWFVLKWRYKVGKFYLLSNAHSSHLLNPRVTS